MKIYLTKGEDGLSFHIMEYKLTTPQSKRAFLKRAQTVMENHGLETAWAEVCTENPLTVVNNFKISIVSHKNFAVKVSEGVL